MFKKIGKFIKRGLKKVGKFIKRGFKKLGKFVGKLGPVGMLGMMIMMPQLGSWWKQFGDWAGTLQGPMKGVMESIHWAGSKVGEAYSSITETISNGLKKIPGVGEAYEGLEEYIGGKLEDVREYLGVTTQDQLALERTGFEKADVNLEEGRVDLKSLEQTNVEQTTESILNRTDTYKPFDPKSGEVTLKTQQQMADESLYSFEDDPSKLINRKGYMEDTTGSIADAKGEETWIDKAKGVYEGVSAVTGTVEEIFGGDEQPVIGGTYVADNMVGLMDTNKAAQIDYAANGFAGQPNWGMGNSDYYNSILQAIMNRADAYERFRPPSIRGI